jgi:hypothetical protein
MPFVKIENLSVAEELDAKATATIWGGMSLQAFPRAAMSGSLAQIGASTAAAADAPQAPKESVSFGYGSLRVVYTPQHAD